MATKRRVEVFSAGCPVCRETEDLVRRLACGACEIEVRDMNDPATAKRARELDIRTVPAVAIDGELVACCKTAGPDESTLRSAGLGTPRDG